MDWTQQFDAYCERTDLTYWSEPINAVTNAAFLIAALVMLWRLRGTRLPLAYLLVGILAAIGVGSYLFHTHATVWAVTADVVPIALFILVYVFVANYHYLNFGLWAALGATLLFIPYAGMMIPIFNLIPITEPSAAYWPVPLLILLYAAFLGQRLPQVSRGLLIGALILIASLTFRTLDEPLCAALPLGTHFMWHILNGIMLGWMIEVYRKHMIATGRA
ncbi:ceramidase domain-containing protein [Pseudaestuariivita rosea]|uniref:ceramidase domain-containing protein n=1 Tax=Pseudaestuariivita rosea TaxID=2763263 RepID=UPI001ABB8A8D|nr:ceramidase domain-containing protein [Pseudaestuariivita rosea]